ncbi:MFS transporter [Prosthecomicrobium sp. N25]|uniref:MFS transporter n=1 Tax=Prosthecomicrobium sp. N25 TaxID=3129254 RepID=UPI003077FE2F
MPVLLAIAAAAFMSTVVMRMTDPVVGPLSQAFGVAPADIAVFATAYAVPYALFQLVFGPFGDRYGKTRVIRIALTVLTLTIVASALAPDYRSMLAIRFFSGMFGGGIIPLGLATIGDRFALPERQIMLSRFMMGTIAGQITGSFLTGVLAEFLDWRTVYLAYAVLSGIIAVALFTMPAVAAGRPEPLTFGGVVRRYAGIVSSEKARVLLPTVFIEGGIFFGFLSFAPAYLSEMRGLSSGEIGTVIAAYGIGGMLFGVTARFFVTRLGTTGMIVGGSLMGGIAIAFLSQPMPLWAYMVQSGAVGMAFTLIHNNLQTRATELAPQARGSSVAVFACCLFLGNGTGPFLMKQAVGVVGYVTLFQALALILTVFGIVSALLIRASERTLPAH